MDKCNYCGSDKPSGTYSGKFLKGADGQLYCSTLCIQLASVERGGCRTY